MRLITERVAPRARHALNTLGGKAPRQDDLYPDIAFTQRRLGVRQTVALEQIVDKTYRWFATPRG